MEIERSYVLIYRGVSGDNRTRKGVVRIIDKKYKRFMSE